MMRGYSFPVLLLLIALLAISVHARDPNCRRGIKRGTACCPRQCRRCGGSGCGARGRRIGRAGQCCTGSIRRSNRVCSRVNAPCKIVGRGRGRGRGRGNNNRTPATTTTATTTTTTSNDNNNNQDPNSNSPVTPVDNTDNSNQNDNNIQPSGGSVSTQGRWETIDNSLQQRTQARHEACFVMVNGQGYLLGGRGNRKVSVFDPRTRTWSDRGNMLTQMHHMQCVGVGRLIYIVSSWFGRSPREGNHENVFVYDTATGSWERKTGMPEPRRRGGAASVYRPEDGRIYVAGGNRGGHGPPSRTLGYFDAYDIQSDSWITDLPPLPEGRDHTGGAMVRGRLCVAGGRDGGQRSFFSKTVASVYCYDFGASRWDRVPDLPTPRGGVSVATTCSGDMMVAGGETGRRMAFQTTEVFDGRSWTTVDGMDTGRHGTGLAVSDCSCGHIFTASGSGQRGGRPELGSTEVFIPSGKPSRCNRY